MSASNRPAAQRSEVPRTGHLASGPRDSLADVPGVTVGHCTLAEGAVQTGVTVIRPHAGSLFLDKVPAAATVLNGFGKSTGLVQVAELGVLETPIALTNTFGVGTVANAQIRQAVAEHPEIGRHWPTVNPLVFECNDGYLNDIQAMAVQEKHYLHAWHDASEQFAQGSVGAGRGMSSFSFKGGIGSASRVVDARAPVGAEAGAGSSDAQPAVTGRWTVGALVLSNFGRLPNLTVAGRPIGRAWLASREAAASHRTAEPVPAQTDDALGPEKGSIIIILATDAPLDARQLKRLSLRAGAGLARTGSVFGHGSGDIALAFSTAYTIPQHAHVAMPAQAMLHESLSDPLFEAAAEATEQAIVNALWHAETVTGRDDHTRLSLPDAIAPWRDWLARTAL
ncbi:MAG: P1 family peptidase [Burkholderiaceae bacterium]